MAPVQYIKPGIVEAHIYLLFYLLSVISSFFSFLIKYDSSKSSINFVCTLKFVATLAGSSQRGEVLPRLLQ